MHHKQLDCTDMKHVSKLEIFLKYLKLFPKKLEITYMLDEKLVTENYGGWADPRDHELCMKMTFRLQGNT